MTRGGWLPGQSGHTQEHNDIDAQFRETPSASYFGAKGDGVHDDTLALQAA